MLPLTTFYRSGAPRSDVYKWDAFVTSWRFYNRAWQPQRHDRPPETSGTLWIHRGALTNQRCSLATGCGITVTIKVYRTFLCKPHLLWWITHLTKKNPNIPRLWNPKLQHLHYWKCGHPFTKTFVNMYWHRTSLATNIMSDTFEIVASALQIIPDEHWNTFRTLCGSSLHLNSSSDIDLHFKIIP